MLGKLIKHDLKSLGRLFILIHVCFIAICLAGRVFFMNQLDFNAPDMSLLTPLIIISSLATFLVVAINFCTGLMITFRFYRNLFGREGYLSWTLPVSGIKHLWAKIISGSIFLIIDTLVIAVGILILVTGRNVVEAYNSVSPEFTQVLGMPLPMFALYMLLFNIAGCFSTLIMIYFCICVGQLFPGHRVLCALAVYFIVSFVIQIIVFLIMTVCGFFDFSAQPAGTVSVDMFRLMAPSAVLMAILTVVQYITIHYIIKRKINLI